MSTFQIRTTSFWGPKTVREGVPGDTTGARSRTPDSPYLTNTVEENLPVRFRSGVKPSGPRDPLSRPEVPPPSQGNGWSGR